LSLKFIQGEIMSDEELPLRGGDPKRNCQLARSLVNQLSDIQVNMQIKRILRASPKYLIPAAFGIMSATLFWPGCKSEAANSWLGEHLTDWLHFNSKYIYFLSAAPGLAILTDYFAANFGAAFSDALKEYSTPARKTLFVLSVGVITAYQLVQPVAVTYGAGGELINIVLAATGQLPGCGWAAINMVAKTAKKVSDTLETFKLNFYGLTRNYIGRNDVYEQEISARQLTQLLRRRVFAGFRHQDLRRVSYDQNLKLIDVLTGLTDNLPDDFKSDNTWLSSGTKLAFQLVGAAMGFLIFMAIFLNVKNILLHFLENTFAAWLVSATLCLGTLFTLLLITAETTGNGFEYLRAKINGHNYLSPIEQIYPIKSIVFFALASFWFLLSYATVKSLFVHNYDGAHPFAMLVMTCISSVVYHVSGGLKGYSLKAKEIAEHNPTEEQASILKVHKVLDLLEKKPKSVLAEVAAVAGHDSEATKRQILGEDGAKQLQVLVNRGFFRVKDVEAAEMLLPVSAERTDQHALSTPPTIEFVA